MTIFLALVTIVLPVFLLMGAGYATTRLKVFPDAGIDYLLKFATGIAVPALLFRAMYRLDLHATIRLEHLASFYLAATICFVLGIVLSRHFWHRRPGESVAVGFCALFSNSVLLGLPIIERAYGDSVLEPAYAIISIHAPFCYLAGIMTMEFLRRDGAGVGTALARTGKAMFTNALTIGLALGFLFNIAGIALPEPVAGTIDLLARAALPVALFGLGGVLSRYTLRRELGEPAMVSTLSLVVHPGIALVLARHVFGLPEEFVRAAVVIAAMPTGINGYVFAALYDRAKRTAASSVLLATALSLGSITFWLALLGGTGPG